MSKQTFLIVVFLMLVPAACMLLSCNENAGAVQNKPSAENTAPRDQPYPLSEEFKKYWYAGKAELCSYSLKQARYGEIHEGTAVTIFVTEDFSGSKQVKLDRPEAAGADRLPVMKLNLVKKFNTGLYPYSMMLSVFSPVDLYNFPDPVKVTASVQEWCGTTFMQMNSKQAAYQVQWNSYFESEGDGEASFSSCLPEDGLWNLIRIAPDQLPLGEKKLLPGSFYTRLSHHALSVQKADLSLTKEGSVNTYHINYRDQQHAIHITFENVFPYKILRWEETYPGFDGKMLSTTAELNKTILSDYWVHHNNADRVMRKELGLPENF